MFEPDPASDLASGPRVPAVPRWFRHACSCLLVFGLGSAVLAYGLMHLIAGSFAQYVHEEWTGFDPVEPAEHRLGPVRFSTSASPQGVTPTRSRLFPIVRHVTLTGPWRLFLHARAPADAQPIWLRVVSARLEKAGQVIELPSPAPEWRAFGPNTSTEITGDVHFDPLLGAEVGAEFVFAAEVEVGTNAGITAGEVRWTLIQRKVAREHWSIR